MKTYPKIDTYRGEAWTDVVTRWGDIFGCKIEFAVKCCPGCGESWQPIGTRNKGHKKYDKFGKGWGFGLGLRKEVCPECEEKRSEI